MPILLLTEEDYRTENVETIMDETKRDLNQAASSIGIEGIKRLLLRYLLQNPAIW